MSETSGTPKLNAALAKLQAVMKAASKDSVNPAFADKNNPKKAKGTPYADMSACWEAWFAAKPWEYGLAITQEPFAPARAKFVGIRTCLLHESGEERRSEVEMPCIAETPQAYGGAMSYAKRYGFKAVTMMVDEDDDGNSASGVASKPVPIAKPEDQADPVAREVGVLSGLIQTAKSRAELDALTSRLKALPEKERDALRPPFNVRLGEVTKGAA